MKRKSKDSRAADALNEATLPYGSSRTSTEFHAPVHAEDPGWADFRDQCRRQMNRPMELRIKYGFCRMYKPVLDDAPWRAFQTMEEYRQWCEENLPEYLGFKRPSK